MARAFGQNDYPARRAVLACLVDGGDLVADRFPQAFDRGYGTVYREAAPINASDKRLQPLVAEVLRLDRQERHSCIRTFVGGLVVYAGSVLLSRLANLIMLGYFTWKKPLTCGQTLFVVGAIVVLAHWA